jgi:hypothetical protein
MESEQGWNIELKDMNKKVFYRYENPHFSISTNQPLEFVKINRSKPN